jgi:hypothetical protein
MGARAFFRTIERPLNKRVAEILHLRQRPLKEENPNGFTVIDGRKMLFIVWPTSVGG